MVLQIGQRFCINGDLKPRRDPTIPLIPNVMVPPGSVHRGGIYISGEEDHMSIDVLTQSWE